ncbi:hypothetical protein LIP_0317 [Limnochorda pilosa]|uniref:Alpha-galactosidase NEW3 domain-containing protein n=1 Tax=Limnochorda pilosa TaxID=1555112 RepID=A0A0K2SH94_LIMPI|nr:hypothetical protein LIP_0317 [Limnochorda pilosa]
MIGGVATISIGVGADRAMGGNDERALVRLHQAIRPLGTVVSFMNTGAHPDDEQSALLAYLSRGLGARVVSVIANRGEGGQNQVGDEYDQALGVVRTRELEEASRVTGVHLRLLSEELDDPIYDFGFSKTPEETLARWGAEIPLERLVRLIREERPDVVMPSFRDEYGQHGHHRAITRLTLEAVRHAADPEAFPEQLSAGLLPWQVRKVYVPANPGGGGGNVYLATETGEVDVTVNTGEFDPVLGVSYVQLGEESRAFHRSQGMGRVVEPGPRLLHAERVLSTVPVAGPERSLFDGLPSTVGELVHTVPDGHEGLRSHLRSIQAGLEAIDGAFPDRETILLKVHDTLGKVRQVLEALDGAGAGGPWAEDLAFRLRVKEEQLQAVSAAATLVIGQIDLEDWEVVQGQEVTLTVRAFNGGQIPLEDVSLRLEAPQGWLVEPISDGPATALGYNETVGRSRSKTSACDWRRRKGGSWSPSRTGRRRPSGTTKRQSAPFGFGSPRKRPTSTLTIPRCCAAWWDTGCMGNAPRWRSRRPGSWPSCRTCPCGRSRPPRS